MVDPIFIDSSDIEIIVQKIKHRQRFFNENFTMSVGVVLLNYGDPFVNVKCINNEWEGMKADLTSRDGIPLCPNGHPLVETSEAPRLALVFKE